MVLALELKNFFGRFNAFSWLIGSWAQCWAGKYITLIYLWVYSKVNVYPIPSSEWFWLSFLSPYFVSNFFQIYLVFILLGQYMVEDYLGRIIVLNWVGRGYMPKSLYHIYAFSYIVVHVIVRGAFKIFVILRIWQNFGKF